MLICHFLGRDDGVDDAADLALEVNRVHLHHVGREKLGDLRALLLGDDLHQVSLDLAAGGLVRELKDRVHPPGKCFW